ncbi:MAG: nucleoside-diphosphate kinase [Nanoarchaeota archaeon]|jgi:nucleoside-diphosphate kinase|nr:nucleoside-diphosphate kinase [Nanoarchaeota archaeon]
MERTLVLIKPDAVLRGIVGEIIQRFERVGMKIAAIKMIQAEENILRKHYYKDEAWMKEKGELYKKKLNLPAETDPIPVGQNIVDGLIQDMQFSPIIAIVLEGHNAVHTVKRLTGPTNIDEATPGTIRGDFSHDTFSLANKSNRPNITIIHATDNPAESQQEIDFWFSPDEIHSYSKPEEKVHYRIQK